MKDRVQTGLNITQSGWIRQYQRFLGDIRTESRTTRPDPIRALARNQESRQKSRHFDGIRIRKTRPTEIPTKCTDSVIAVGRSPAPQHFSML